MTMSGKVIVKFLTPIHENEIKGETFTLFQSSAAMRNKVVRSDKECSESSSGIQYDEVEQSSAGGAGEEKERWAGASGGKSLGYVEGAGMGSGLGSGGGTGPGRERGIGQGVSRAMMRDRMARLVRFRMLQVRVCVGCVCGVSEWCVYLWVGVCVWAYVCMYVRISMYVRTYVRMNAIVFVYVRAAVHRISYTSCMYVRTYHSNSVTLY